MLRDRCFGIALGSILVYSATYGVLEYIAFHSPNYNGALKISKYLPNMYFYWAFMYLTAVGITFAFCRNWISAFWSMWLFPVIEDLFFFISLSIHEHHFPFPVSNWYDEAFSITKFIRLGQATMFWPFFPRSPRPRARAGAAAPAPGRTRPGEPGRPPGSPISMLAP